MESARKGEFEENKENEGKLVDGHPGITKELIVTSLFVMSGVA